MKSFGGGSNAAGVSMSNNIAHIAASQQSASATSLSFPTISVPTLSYSPSNSQTFSHELMMTNPMYQGIDNATASALRGIRGRQNANGAIYNSWWSWLSTHNTATGQDDGNGNLIYTYSKGELEALYDSFVEYWSKNFMAEIPGFDEWLSWYISSTGESGYVYNDDTYRYIPVGNIMSLFIFAFIYCGYVYFRIRKGRKINTDF